MTCSCSTARGTRPRSGKSRSTGSRPRYLPGVLPGAISITANSTRNALVVGMTQNRMEVSAGLEGPWQLLGSGGQDPAFQTPALPVAAQS